MPSVAMKEGMRKSVVTRPLTTPMLAAASEGHDQRQPLVPAVDHEQGGPHDRREGEVLADGQVELAADHQHRDADGHDCEQRRDVGDGLERLGRPDLGAGHEPEHADHRHEADGRAELTQAQQSLASSHGTAGSARGDLGRLVGRAAAHGSGRARSALGLHESPSPSHQVELAGPRRIPRGPAPIDRTSSGRLRCRP